MRKIKTKKEEQKRSKRNSWILVGFMLVILLGSTFGIIVNSFGNSNSDEKESYNGYEFYSQGSYWILDVNNIKLSFLYHPTETENFSNNVVLDDYINSYQNSVVYIYSEDSNSEIEIYRNIYYFVERMQNACPEGKECADDVPMKDCSDRFIIIEEFENNEVVQDDKCIYIRGDKENLIKLSDEFLYNLFGIK